MRGRGLVVGMLAVAAVVAGCGSGEGSKEPSGGEPSDGIDRGEAAPVAGASKLVTLPNTDTLTVPLGYELKMLLGETLAARLSSDAGEAIVTIAACGSTEASIGPENGQLDRAVNVDFYYGHSTERTPFVVSLQGRGPCNLIFTDVVSEEDALRLARTYTAVSPPSPLPGYCVFEEP